MKRFFLVTAIGVVVICQARSGAAQTNVLNVRPDDETRQLLRNATEDKWFKKDNFLSAVLGGFIAAAAGILVARYTHRLEIRQKETEDAEFVNNVLRAIRRELEALGAVYEQGIRTHLNPLVDGQVLEVRLALTQNWFTVFNANAVHLGRLPADISRRVIFIYAATKGLIEEFRINNEYLSLLGAAEAAIRLRPEAEHLKEKEKVREWLLHHAAKLRKLDAELGNATQELFRILDERGIK